MQHFELSGSHVALPQQPVLPGAHELPMELQQRCVNWSEATQSHLSALQQSSIDWHGAPSVRQHVPSPPQTAMPAGSPQHWPCPLHVFCGETQVAPPLAGFPPVLEAPAAPPLLAPPVAVAPAAAAPELPEAPPLELPSELNSDPPHASTTTPLAMAHKESHLI